MARQTPAADTPFESKKIQAVSERFAKDPALPWMLAAGALVEAYKVLSIRIESTLGSIDDLSMSRFEILGLLDRAAGGRLTVGALKRATYLHPPTLTYTLDWLEHRGLVQRQPSKEDRRTMLIQVTAAGRKVFARATRALGEIHYGLEGISEIEAYEVARALTHTSPA